MGDTITIIGNVGADPKLVHTTGGVPIATFSVASEQRRYDRASEKWIDTEPNWYRVSAFRALAVHTFESLRKGQRVVVAGRLRLRDWNSGDRQGTAAEIDADAIGHDLLFGTTSFLKSSTQSAAMPPQDSERSPSDADGEEPPDTDPSSGAEPEPAGHSDRWVSPGVPAFG